MEILIEKEYLYASSDGTYTVDSAYLDYGGKMCDNRLYFYHGY